MKSTTICSLIVWTFGLKIELPVVTAHNTLPKTRVKFGVVKPNHQQQLLMEHC